MRLATALIVMALAAPAAAQIETQQLEPLLLPSEGGDITVQPVQREAPEGARPQEADPFREGFNDDAFRDGGSPRTRDPFSDEDSFIDRAFSDRMRDDDGQFRRAPGVSGDGSGLEVTPLPPADDEQDLVIESEVLEEGDLPRFREAPFTSRRLFGPGQRRLLPRIETVSSEVVQLRTLDKMTGATRELVVDAGEEREVGRLKVMAEGCRQAADGGKHGTTAFLRIWDPARNGPEPVFEGWMFAESPALSAMDHPRYDVWLVSCAPERASTNGEPDEG